MLSWFQDISCQKLPKPSLQILMDSKPLNMSMFLDEEDFMPKLRHRDIQLLDFIHRERREVCKGLIHIVIDSCNAITDANYAQYITHPQLVLEIIALEVGPIMNAFSEERLGDELFTLLFSMLKKQTTIPEPQMANFSKFLQPLLTKIRISIPIMACLDHKYSAQITNLLVILLNLDTQNLLTSKVEVFRVCFKQFHNMDAMEVLNFMVLIHEMIDGIIRCDQLNDSLMSYLVSREPLQLMFDSLKVNANIFTSKAAAHILSLISNFYSYSMQNIDVSNPMTIQFESSDFYFVFFKNLTTLSELLGRKISVLSYKVVEVNYYYTQKITDNLVRISNLKLWHQISQSGLLNQIFKMYLHHSNANIIHTVVEKLVLYMLNRTVSEFHPYWTRELFVVLKILDLFSNYLDKFRPNGPILLMINHFSWFIKELQEKTIQQGTNLQISEITRVFATSRSWFNCIQVSSLAETPEKWTQRLLEIGRRNQLSIELRKIDREPPNKLFESITTNNMEPKIDYHNLLRKSTYEEEMPSEYVRAYSSLIEIDNALNLDSEVNINDTTQKEWINDLNQVQDTPQHYFTNLNRKDSFNLSINNSENNSVNNSPVLHQDAEYSDNLNLKRRTSAMDFSLKLKSMGKDAQPEFHIASQFNEDKVVVQPANMQIMRVDELDIDKSLDLNSSRCSIGLKRAKISFKVDPLSGSKKENPRSRQQDQMSTSIVSSTSSESERRFRRLQPKDKLFLKFIQDSTI